jgi:hypothetical protein
VPSGDSGSETEHMPDETNPDDKPSDSLF